MIGAVCSLLQSLTVHYDDLASRHLDEGSSFKKKTAISNLNGATETARLRFKSKVEQDCRLFALRVAGRPGRGLARYPSLT